MIGRSLQPTRGSQFTYPAFFHDNSAQQTQRASRKSARVCCALRRSGPEYCSNIKDFTVDI